MAKRSSYTTTPSCTRFVPLARAAADLQLALLFHHNNLQKAKLVPACSDWNVTRPPMIGESSRVSGLHFDLKCFERVSPFIISALCQACWRQMLSLMNAVAAHRGSLDILANNAPNILLLVSCSTELAFCTDWSTGNALSVLRSNYRYLIVFSIKLSSFAVGQPCIDC
jgi:hypothetical protein